MGHSGPCMPVLTLSQTPSEMVVLKHRLLPVQLQGGAREDNIWGVSLWPSLGPSLAFLLLYSHYFSSVCVLLQPPSKLFTLDPWVRKASYLSSTLTLLPNTSKKGPF